MVSLEIHSSGRRRIFQILDEEFSIGAAADLPLNGPHVRERHVRCRVLESGLLVEPEGGVPRLIVNGKSTQGATLRHGDRLEVGTFLLVLVEDDEPAPFVKDSWIPDEEKAALALADEEEKGSDGLALRIELPGQAKPKAASPASPARRSAPERKVRGSRDPLAGSQKKAASPAPQRKAPARRTAPVSRRAAPARSDNSWMMWTAIGAVAVLVLVFVLSGGGGDATKPRKQDMGELAESQWASGDPEAALRTIQMAIDKAQGSRRSELQAKREAWQYTLLRRADEAEILAAQRSYSRITRFVRDDLARNPEGRAANRELFRQAETWLTSFAGVAERHEELQGTADEVRRLREKARGPALPSSPDTAEDVLFRVDYLMRFPMRSYRQILESMENYLADAGDTEAGVREVRKRLREIRSGGPSWLAGQKERAQTRWRNGDQAGAIGLLRQLVANVPDDWARETRLLLEDYSARADF